MKFEDAMLVFNLINACPFCTRTLTVVETKEGNVIKECKVHCDFEFIEYVDVTTGEKISLGFEIVFNQRYIKE